MMSDDHDRVYTQIPETITEEMNRQDYIETIKSLYQDFLNTEQKYLVGNSDDYVRLVSDQHIKEILTDEKYTPKDYLKCIINLTSHTAYMNSAINESEWIQDMVRNSEFRRQNSVNSTISPIKETVETQ